MSQRHEGPGSPPEPAPPFEPIKVTSAERLQYGDMAPLMRRVTNGAHELHEGMRYLAAIIRESEQFAPQATVGGGSADALVDLIDNPLPAWKRVFDALSPVHDELLEQLSVITIEAAQGARDERRRFARMTQPQGGIGSNVKQGRVGSVAAIDQRVVVCAGKHEDKHGVIKAISTDGELGLIKFDDDESDWISFDDTAPE